MTAADPTSLAELASDMRDADPDRGVAIREAAARWGVGADGEPVIRLSLVLDDPPDGITWEPDLLLDLQTRALGLARSRGFDAFVFVDLTSRSEADEDMDSEPELDELGRRLEEELPEDGSRPSDPKQ